MKAYFRRTLTLVEVLVAVVIFSVLSLSLYSLLRTGISLRKRIDLDEARLQDSYLNLEKISKEIKSIIIFKKDDEGFFPLDGDSQNLHFVTLAFDYPTNSPKIIDVSYVFENNALSRTIKDIFGEETTTFEVFQDLKEFNFYYFDDSKEEGLKWQEEWKGKKDLPLGIRIELVYEDKKGKDIDLSKYVCIYR